MQGSNGMVDHVLVKGPRPSAHLKSTSEKPYRSDTYWSPALHWWTLPIGCENLLARFDS